MRTNAVVLSVLASLGALVGAGSGIAHADGPAGVYQVKYAEVANNCSDTGIVMATGTLTITEAKGAVVVDIERIPLMRGKPGKTSRIKAASTMGHTPIQGLDGKFSVAGRVEDGVVQLVFIGEYYLNKRALCTQSWNVTGVSQAGMK